MDFKVVQAMQCGKNFVCNLYDKKSNIGAVSRDDEGVYVNLIRRLTMYEMIELLEIINGISQDIYKEDLSIQYTEDIQ